MKTSLCLPLIVGSVGVMVMTPQVVSSNTGFFWFFLKEKSSLISLIENQQNKNDLYLHILPVSMFPEVVLKASSSFS